MKIPVLWLSYKDDVPPRGYWDHALIEDLFSGKLWPSQTTKYIHCEDGFVDHWDELKDGSQQGGVVVINAQKHLDYVERLNKDLAKMKWVLLVITSNEEGTFPWQDIKHPKMRIWVQTPKPGAVLPEGVRAFPVGYTPHTSQIDNYTLDRKWDVFLSAQNTHERRENCFDALAMLRNQNESIKMEIHETAGFTQGMSPEEYVQNMTEARIVPCPSGVTSPDSFRIYEALQSGAIPIADELSPRSSETGYYDLLGMGDMFPTIRDYASLPGYIDDQLQDWYTHANMIGSKWIEYKRSLAMNMDKDINHLMGTSIGAMSSIIITASPIPSHPDIEILEETINSAREHMPSVEIIIMFDGSRDDLPAERVANYKKHINRVLHHAQHVWRGVRVFISPEHVHQATLTKMALQKIETPYLLFMEHDTPLVTDYSIEWRDCDLALATGDLNVIRFHHEASIPKEHLKMVHGTMPGQKNPDIEFIRTSQWSQRPHLASTAFYKMMMEAYFKDTSRCFIEDVIHGRAAQAFIEDGMNGWYNWRIGIYSDKTNNLKRSYHLDGRAGEDKHDTEQVF